MVSRLKCPALWPICYIKRIERGINFSIYCYKMMYWQFACSIFVLCAGQITDCTVADDRKSYSKLNKYIISHQFSVLSSRMLKIVITGYELTTSLCETCF